MSRQKQIPAPNAKPKRSIHDRPIDRSALALVQDLAERTAATVVIVSSWRRWFSPEVLAGHLEMHGLNVPIECAPLHSDGNRTREIRDWLAAHPEVTRWVVLDDDPMRELAALDPRVIRPRCRVGLTASEMVQAGEAITSEVRR